MDTLLQKIRHSWLASTITVVVLWILVEGGLSWFVSFAPGTAIVVGLVVLAAIALMIGALFYVSGRDT